MKWTSNVASVLLITHRYHLTGARFEFSRFVSMSTWGSIYVLYTWSIFHYHFHFHYNLSHDLIKTDAIVFLHILFSSSQKFSLRLLNFWLFFVNFSLLLLMKVFLIKKRVVSYLKVSKRKKTNILSFTHMLYCFQNNSFLCSD